MTQRPLTPERDLFILRSVYADIVSGVHPLYRLPAHALQATGAGVGPSPPVAFAQQQQQQQQPVQQQMPVMMMMPTPVPGQPGVGVQQAFPSPMQSFPYLQQQQQQQQQPPPQQQPHFQQPYQYTAPQQQQQYQMPVMPPQQRQAGPYRYGDLDRPATGSPVPGHQPLQTQQQSGLPYDGRHNGAFGPAPGFPPSIAGPYAQQQQHQQYQLDPRMPPQSYS